MKNENTLGKKALAVAGALGLALAGGLAGATLFPVEKTVTETKVEEIIREVNKTIEVEVEVVKEVPVNVTVEKLVEVDNGNLDLVLQHLFDNKGEVDYLTSGLKESEIDQIVERIVFVNEAIALAENEASAKLFRLVNKEVVDGVTIDDREISRVKFFDETVLDTVNFKREDAGVLVIGEFEQDRVFYDFTIRVDIKDNEVDRASLVTLEKQ